MDRFAWLECQPWLLPWYGCAKSPELQCTPCSKGKSKLCEKVKWVFQGFASFHVTAKDSQEQQGTALDCCPKAAGPLAPNATHLFFSTPPPLADPAQLVLRLGITEEQSSSEQGPTSRSHGSNKQISPFYSGGTPMLLIFDDSSPFFLDFGQVETITMWKPEQGCCLCSGEQSASRKQRSANNQSPCVCQQMPLHVTVDLRHIKVNIYSAVQAMDASAEVANSTFPTKRIMEHLHEALARERLQSSSNQLEHSLLETAIRNDTSQTDTADSLKSSNLLLQQFLKGIDCMSECALKAVEVCTADLPWMGRLLLLMAQHAADSKSRFTELKTLHRNLVHQLQAMQEEEKIHVATIFSGSSPDQEARALAISALQHSREQREHLEEAVLWLDLIHAAIRPCYLQTT